MKRSLTTVGAYDAKTHFSELLERVAKGEEITITRHGLPVACMVPYHIRSTAGERRAAVKAIRELSKENRLGGLKVKELIAEGRR